MKLTIREIQHVDDVEWPVSGPVEFVMGPRDTLWAEDETGRFWHKAPDEERWTRCNVRGSTSSA